MSNIIKTLITINITDFSVEGRIDYKNETSLCRLIKESHKKRLAEIFSKYNDITLLLDSTAIRPRMNFPIDDLENNTGRNNWYQELLRQMAAYISKINKC